MHRNSELVQAISDVVERVATLESRPLSDPAWANMTQDLARLLLRRARQLELPRERTGRHTLAQLLSYESNQVFSNALTDRIHRSHRASTVAAVFAELLERSNVGPGFSSWDRLQLQAGKALARLTPGAITSGLMRRVKKEATPYLWQADQSSLLRHLEEAHRAAIQVNLNYLGEEVLGEDEANGRLLTYAELATRGDIDAISVKLSGIDCRLDPLAFDATVSRLSERLARILIAGLARDGGPPLVYLDMEAYRDLELTNAVVLSLLQADGLCSAHPELRLGLAVQTYLPESVETVRKLAQASHEHVRRGGVPLRLRLVKGANLQMERVEASLRGLSCPILDSKAEVDANFKRTLREALLFAQNGDLHVGIASHNLFDLAYSVLLRRFTRTEDKVAFEMLEGMAGGLGRALHEYTQSLLIYAPAVSDAHFNSAISYLVRRLDENTAADNFLRDAPLIEPDSALFDKHLRAFQSSLSASFASAPATLRNQNRSASIAPPPTTAAQFHNAPDTDWTRAANRAWLHGHLTQAQAAASVRPLIGGSPPASQRTTARGFDPSVPEFHYPVELASRSDIEHSIEVAYLAHRDATLPPLAQRTQQLRQTARLLESSRGELIAAMLLDSGKRPYEADIEVSEAIDFANYYAKCAEQGQLGAPRGPTVITPPWNFPLAIPLGGALAAYVAGNPVILKPAPETPWVAQLAVRLCHKAGIACEALQFVPCDDTDASPFIQDPRVAAVVLTGATSTALKFLEMRPELYLMAETGGKNAAYLSDVSDRESAIAHIVASAFGHAGQKCSALSVLIAHRDVFNDEEFQRQLVDACQSLVVGSAWDMESFVTPLIRPPEGPLALIVEEGTKYGRWLLQPQSPATNPRQLSPGILWGAAPGSFPHLTEFFGPVLTVLCADDFQHGMQLLNQSSYGLTAGLFSLRETEQEQFVQHAAAGNLYINRSLTGAVVARQPFGGRKDSCFGPGAKAGGADYVQQLTLPPPLPRELSHEQLQKLRREYEAAAVELHSVRDGTEVYGELNLIRHTPGKTAVVLLPGASPGAIELTLLARTLSGAALSIFVAAEAAAELHGLPAVATALTSESAVQHPAEALPALARAQGAERLRVLGTPTPQFLRLAREQHLTVLTDPTSRQAHCELRLYMQPQSISFSVHRHGNTNLRRLSRLREVLK